MSVSSGLIFLDWPEFSHAYAAADGTEALFHPAVLDAAPYVVRGDGGDSLAGELGSYDAALDASSHYDFIREYLGADARDAADQVFAALFWVFDVQEAGESPWGPGHPETPAAVSDRVRFSPLDLPVKGDRVYLRSLLSPDSAARLASLWTEPLRDDVTRIAAEHFDEEELGDWFAGADELGEYYDRWGCVLRLASERGAGLAVLVG